MLSFFQSPFPFGGFMEIILVFGLDICCFLAFMHSLFTYGRSIIPFYPSIFSLPITVVAPHLIQFTRRKSHFKKLHTAPIGVPQLAHYTPIDKLLYNNKAIYTNVLDKQRPCINF